MTDDVDVRVRVRVRVRVSVRVRVRVRARLRLRLRARTPAAASPRSAASVASRVSSASKLSSVPRTGNLARLRRAGGLNTVNIESVRAALSSKLKTQNSTLKSDSTSLLVLKSRRRRTWMPRFARQHRRDGHQANPSSPPSLIATPGPPAARSRNRRCTPIPRGAATRVVTQRSASRLRRSWPTRYQAFATARDTP